MIPGIGCRGLKSGRKRQLAGLEQQPRAQFSRSTMTSCARPTWTRITPPSASTRAPHLTLLPCPILTAIMLARRVIQHHRANLPDASFAGHYRPASTVDPFQLLAWLLDPSPAGPPVRPLVHLPQSLVSLAWLQSPCHGGVRARRGGGSSGSRLRSLKHCCEEGRFPRWPYGASGISARN